MDSFFAGSTRSITGCERSGIAIISAVSAHLNQPAPGLSRSHHARGSPPSTQGPSAPGRPSHAQIYTAAHAGSDDGRCSS